MEGNFCLLVMVQVPPFSVTVSTISSFSTWQAPLTHTDDDLGNCLWAVERNIPIIYIGGGVAGLTAPITGAGLLVSNLACMLNLAFWVETDIDKRAFLYLDSVLLSGEWADA